MAFHLFIDVSVLVNTQEAMIITIVFRLFNAHAAIAVSAPFFRSAVGIDFAGFCTRALITLASHLRPIQILLPLVVVAIQRYRCGPWQRFSLTRVDDNPHTVTLILWDAVGVPLRRRRVHIGAGSDEWARLVRDILL